MREDMSEASRQNNVNTHIPSTTQNKTIAHRLSFSPRGRERADLGQRERQWVRHADVWEWLQSQRMRTLEHAG